MAFDMSGRRHKKTPDTEMQAVPGINPIENGVLEQNHNTTADRSLSREFVQAELAKLPMDKQVGYCLWKIGLLCGREQELTVEDYRPDMTMWQAIDKAGQAKLLKELQDEMFALMLFEQKTGRAKFALTMRDKLLLYIEACDHITEMAAEVLDRPCTWADFKRLIAKDIAKGRGQQDADE